MENLKKNILDWAAERDLLKPENATKQALKLSEEVGELAGAIIKNKRPEQIDAIGDILVVLTILSEQLNIDMEDALASAYGVIKDRKGKTIDGAFVKDEQ